MNFTSNGVGRWLAAAEKISENTMNIGCYQIEFCIKHSAPSSRELLSEAKLRELKRLFQIIKTPSVIFCNAKNDSPLKDGAEAQIEFDMKIGQGRALSLRLSVRFYSILAANRYISTTF